MMISKIFMFILSLVVIPSMATAAECPLGKGETELTFTRVMINFGRYTRNADFVSNVGQGQADAVKEEQLDSALVDLPIATACATAVITDSILPGKTADMEPAALQTYSDKLKARMQEFVGMLDTYFVELTLQKSKAVADRNFAKAYETSQLIKSWVGEIHEELAVRDNEYQQ